MMEELTIATLCDTLSNLTNNRCNFVENSNTCRCIGSVIHSISSKGDISTSAPDIMLSEVFLIFFVLAIWLSAIGFCLNQYKSLRRLETQVHYCVNRKDPLNIGEIKIVEREQDSIIYKKKRYSTALDTHISPQELNAMHYVQEYLPKNTIKKCPSAISALVLNRDDLLNTTPLSTATRFDSSNNIALTTYHETSEYQKSRACSKTDMESNRYNLNISHIQRTGSARYSTGLTVPHISASSSSHSSWNDKHMCETSSTQHLCVPSTSLVSNSYSSGNISLPVPQITQQNSGEQLLDPRLIPVTVRRSLLALHRESQENINMFKKKNKTQSENDVYGTLTPLKMKMKSKSKRTYTEQYRPHSKTLSNVPLRTTNIDHDRRLLEYVTMQKENSSSLYHPPRSTTPLVRRSLKNCPKYFTQSTSESEPTQDSPLIKSIYKSTDDESFKK